MIFVVLVPNYNKDAMFLILYGFHDPSLNKSIVNSRVVTLLQEWHPSLC
jgi:hypothetical protein